MTDISQRCSWCKKAFKPKRDWQKYCSKDCRQKAFEHRNPRQKIGKRSFIIINGWAYQLKNPVWVGKKKIKWEEV